MASPFHITLVQRGNFLDENAERTPVVALSLLSFSSAFLLCFELKVSSICGVRCLQIFSEVVSSFLLRVSVTPRSNICPFIIIRLLAVCFSNQNSVSNNSCKIFEGEAKLSMQREIRKIGKTIKGPWNKFIDKFRFVSHMKKP